MKTVTGNGIVTVGDAAPYKKELTVYGNTRQNLWVNPSGTNSGVTVTSNDDGSMTLSGTSSAYAIVSVDSYILRKGGTYTVIVDNEPPEGATFRIRAYNGSTWVKDIVNGIPSNSARTFITPNDDTYDRVVFALVAPNGTVVSGTYRVMLNEGSEAEPWCPPGIHGVEELALATAGKNLAAKFSSATQNGVTMTVGEDGAFDAKGNYSSYTASNIKYPTWFEKGETYTASFTVDEAVSGLNAFFYFSWRKPGNVFYGSANVNVGKSLTFTIPEDADSVYMCMYFGKQNDSYPVSVDLRGCRIQIERGTEATSYEPPNITQTTIDLQGHPLHSLPDGTRDELHVDSSGACVIDGRAKKRVLDGSENWAASAIGTNTYTFVLSDGDYEAENNAMCDSLPVIAYDEMVDGIFGIRIGITSSGTKSVWISNTGKELAEFKSWLTSNPVTIVYESEQTIELGTIEMPYMLRGLNNVMAVSDVTPEIELSYYPLAPCSDGIIANDRHSFHDLGQCIASRNTGAPEKKAITKTVPFMSGFYDFSNLYGGIAYESREISYSFELLGDSREDLQRQKSELMEWLSYVHDTEIRDDDVPGWHFVGSFSGYSWDETADGESGTLEVTFLCQPFMEADEETSKALAIGTHTVTNDGQPVNPVVSVASGTAKITINGFVQSVTGETRLSVQLPHGDTSVKVEGAAATLKWKEARI